MEKFTETTKAESEGLADIAAASNERCSRDLSELDASRKKRVAGVRIEDIWTLDHITLLRLQPLMEAFDSDVSTWVTVTEVNAFTQSRPRDWRHVLTKHLPTLKADKRTVYSTGWPTGQLVSRFRQRSSSTHSHAIKDFLSLSHTIFAAYNQLLFGFPTSQNRFFQRIEH